MSAFTLHHGDCLDVLRGIADNSVDAVITDPPYFKVKGEAWDNQWDKPDAFLLWLDSVLAHFQRIIKPNGSLYIFASPRMGARVELLVGQRFNVLNNIRWRKEQGRHKAACKEGLRQFFPASETIIFAEHYGADNIAKGEAGYAAKCDELRGFVFEPLRAYIAGEWERAGLTPRDANVATDSFMAGHYLSSVQWTLPTREKYEQLRAYANRHGGEYLRREYEELRRPFSVTRDVPYTDVWDFGTVQAYKGKHPCEKPQAMLEHMIKSSTKPGAVVLDAFMGTGSCGIACAKLGRKFIGIEMDVGYMESARARIQAAILPLMAA
jgi:site-specific DNA-methyltransferase (adenine-specific)